MEFFESEVWGAALPSRDVFERALSQHARLLGITTPLPDAALVVECMHGREALSACYAFDIDCLSSSVHLELKRFLGEEITLSLLLADGTTRRWHGLVTYAAQLGADGGLARYRISIEPWLALLAYRRRSRLFQDQSVDAILDAVFAECRFAHYRFELTRPLSPRSLCVQFRETDFDFVARLLASEGLSYRFEHDQNDAAPEASEHARHQLVIFDAESALPDCPQNPIRFHRNHATEASDTIQVWRSRAAVLPNHFVHAGWDYKQLIAHGGQAQRDPIGEAPPLEHYDARLAYPYASAAEAEHAAQRAADYTALARATHRLEATVRQLAPGQRFALSQHPHYHGEDSRFTLLAVEHAAANNLEGGATVLPLWSALSADPDPVTAERGSYRCRALCAAADLPVVPQPLPKPKVPGLQSAIVVGPESASSHAIHSDRDGRVRIQFPWQRGRRPLPGSLESDTERATHDEANATWVRVVEWQSGPNWGTSFLPRIGAEVLVDFIAGDPDRPVIVGQLYNGEDRPPWPAGEGSGANHPGVISGLHAPTLDGQHWSQWQLDDATGQLRTRLATSQAASQLNLGYLIHMPATGTQRGAYRGQGFELRTDAWAIARAAHGLLLSGSARTQARSTQLDTAEAAGQLKAAHDTAQRLSDAASQSQADALAQANRIDAFQKIIRPDAADPEQAEHANGTGHPGDPVTGFSQPALLMEAPASIALTTPQSTTLFAGQHLNAVAQGDAQLTAQHSFSAVAGEGASLYTHAGGIQAIAANGPLSIQAHDGPLEILADQDVQVTSTHDEIHVLASSTTVLQAGQSSITLEGGNITIKCPGNFTAKGGAIAFAGGGSAAASPEELPDGLMSIAPSSPIAMCSSEPAKYSERIVIVSPLTGEAISTKYMLGGQERIISSGRSTADGFGKRYIHSRPAQLEHLWGASGEWKADYQDESPPLAPADENCTDEGAE